MFSKIFKQLHRDESGATMVEYGVAVLLAVVVGTAGLILLANQVNGNLSAAATTIQTTE